MIFCMTFALKAMRPADCYFEGIVPVCFEGIAPSCWCGGGLFVPFGCLYDESFNPGATVYIQPVLQISHKT